MTRMTESLPAPRSASPPLTTREKRTARDRLVATLRGDLIGPSHGDAEELPERPDKRYLMSMLFPRNATAAPVVEEEETSAPDAGAGGSNEDEATDGFEAPTDLLFQRLPASVGFSFAVPAGHPFSVEIRAGAGTYRKRVTVQEGAASGVPPQRGGSQRRRASWVRSGLFHPASGQEERVDILSTGAVRRGAFGGWAQIHVSTRSGPEDSWIVTVSLVNERTVTDENGRYDPEDCLYQVSLEAVPSVAVLPWPSPERLTVDPEEDELALQYRDRPALAVGHGCAADWSPTGNGRTRIRVEFLPSIEVAPVTTRIRDLDERASRALSLQRLQSEAVAVDDLLGHLRALVEAYAAWRRGLDAVPTDDHPPEARTRILDRIDDGLRRMRDGCDLLARDADALRCFRLANRAMLVQMAYSGRVKSAERGGRPAVGRVDPDDAMHAAYEWRPFQLAFLLLVLRSMWEEGDPFRDVVDLIWFPTGGGKTEAYLAAAAFDMLRRRLRDPGRGGGTAVIMRYTLRLLTQQQFQRAGHLICALESLRMQDERSLGGEPFSLGLWIGSGNAPNALSDAAEKFDRLIRQRPGPVRNPFILLRCPACGSPVISPTRQTDGDEDVGIRCTPAAFEFFCLEPRCEFHRSIPVQIVDEALYRAPPTMLLATLDKFAMMAWKENAGRFFGAGTRNAPPSLVIQDELHLISGPLGTVAGGYEAAIDAVIAHRGGRPKVIASTATIRRSADQALGLFAKEAAVFPPAGLTAGETFFSRPDPDVPGRLYLGAMAQGHTPTFSNVLASASLLTAVPRLGLSDAVDDSWWTLVVYHNSRRELGRSLTLARDDIPSRIAALHPPGTSGARALRRVQELSANVKGEDIPNVIEEVSAGKGTPRAIDYLGCTNMLSVGVDIDRLGLMMVLGQPKTASEYIQATSRVGRDGTRLPGVVLALYSPTKPRDRSHYENFRPFHDALYRFVEPTSVTPFALPARERVFHAAMISAIRMGTALSGNADAARFSTADPQVRALADRLYERMRRADPTERRGIDSKAAEVERWWETRLAQNLRYAMPPQAMNFPVLIKQFGEQAHPEARETLQSMRHVDVGVRVWIRGARPSDAPSGGNPPTLRPWGGAARRRNGT
ncbi:helicase-related protein [Teichococcus aestuarii]|uniref:Helicase n=1 Tax=Teichococcus aestuarii TaxID=568898 RepID=A0A2U1V523_9PROT|nr:helicase-related protein [Pseudoroseomonas aestuarii]PWC29028.1 helicase [Pseudoroseomonas aestuarii]